MADPRRNGSMVTLGDVALLVPGLVHEMRHPLTGIKAGLELMSSSLGPALTGLDEWEMVVSQVRRLEETLQGFQALLEPGGEPAVPFVVEPVVRHAVELLRFRVRRLGPRFAVAVEAGVPPAHGSPRALLHAVTNLVVNALDAVEEVPEARVEVRVLPSADGHGAQVRVADGGTGVAPGERARLFEPGFTTKPRGKGTGLGLYVARRMIETARGRVRLLEADGARRGWARTEFAIDLAPLPPEAT